MIDPEQGGGSLLDQGPYPSVWAMLAMHHHPDNKDKDPQVVSSYQRIYERSGVDSYSQWIVQWKGLGEAVCVTDMTASGYDDACVVISCEEADVVLSCEYSDRLCQKTSRGLELGGTAHLAAAWTWR